MLYYIRINFKMSVVKYVSKTVKKSFHANYIREAK